MSIHQRLVEVWDAAAIMDFSDKDKIILMSDCHRGDNSWSDDFADNQLLFYHALHNYSEKGFTYIEIGDGDELWENKNYADIMDAHNHIFKLMNQLHKQNRLHIIYGNHDIERLDRAMMHRANQEFYLRLVEQNGPKAWVPEFDEMEFPEAIKLRYSATGQILFLVHGMQFDPFNDRWWRIGEFFNRYIWKDLQIIGFKDPTSPAKNAVKMNKVDRRIEEWLKAWNETHEQPMILIAGHTHHPRFPEDGEVQYFNTGCSIHPRGITGIEIQNGEIALVKWLTTVKLSGHDEGVLTVAKETLGGPRKIADFAAGT